MQRHIRSSGSKSDVRTRGIAEDSGRRNSPLLLLLLLFLPATPSEACNAGPTMAFSCFSLESSVSRYSAASGAIMLRGPHPCQPTGTPLHPRSLPTLLRHSVVPTRNSRVCRTGVSPLRASTEMRDGEQYELVPAGSSGTWTVKALTWGDEEVGETFHPQVGVIAEGQSLYVDQLRMRELCHTPRSGSGGEYVVWDVGLGAAGNAIVSLNALDAAGCAKVRMVSFDRTLGALAFALQHAESLGYVLGWESTLAELVESTHKRTVAGCAVTCAHVHMRGGCEVTWECFTGDFPTLILESEAGSLAAAPDAVMYDAFSPARCADMWTLPLLSRLREHIGDGACLLSTSSRSTIVRASLLLAGFFVGVGTPTGGTAFRAKEETTTASTSLGLLAFPLERTWLDRVARSSAAEPLVEGGGYVRGPAEEGTLAALRAHVQFN